MPRLPGERSCHVKIAINIEGEALWPPQAPIKGRDLPCESMLYTESKLEVVGPLTNRSPAGRTPDGKPRRWARVWQKQKSAGLADLENRSAAIADVEIFPGQTRFQLPFPSPPRRWLLPFRATR